MKFEKMKERMAKANRAVEVGIILNDEHFKGDHYSFSKSLRGVVIPVSHACGGIVLVKPETLVSLGVDAASGLDYPFPVEDFDLADE